jgi:hypothetical protein
MSNNEEQKIDCKVICDLMVVYASGEASEETIQFIEAHIADCPDCQEAYEAAQRGEDLLAELEPAPRPIQFDGRKILIRVQRIFFGIATLALLVAVIAIALAERWIVRGLIGIQLPQLYILPGGGEWFLITAIFLALFGLLYFWRVRAPGGDRSPLALIGAALLFLIGLVAYKFMLEWRLPGILVAGTLTFVLYILLLHGRTQQKSSRFSGEFLLSLESAVPLLILVIATLTLISSSDFASAAFATGLLVVALLFTLIRIGELPYMSLFSLLTLFVGGLMLIGNAFGGFVTLFDLTPNWPATLGHPTEIAESATQLDLTPLRYTYFESFSPAELDDMTLPEGVIAYESLYIRPSGDTASITLLQFPDQIDAQAFFARWHNYVSDDFYAIWVNLSGTNFNEPDGYAEHPLNWRLELPGVWFGQEGQFARSYDENALKAFNAWQTDEWVTIIEVEGGVAQAIPLSRQIKELVSESYLP